MNAAINIAAAAALLTGLVSMYVALTTNYCYLCALARRKR